MMFPFIFPVLTSMVLSAPIQNPEFGYFWHLTDLHYDSRYKVSIESHHSLTQELNQHQTSKDKDYFIGDYDPGCWTEGRGQFGDYNCDSPLALINSATDFIKKFPKPQDGDVNFILWTGDDTSHANDTYFNKTLVLEAVDAISSKVADIGLDVYPVLGNHDIHPKKQFPVPGQNSSDWDNFYDDVAIIWQRRLQTSVQILDQFTYNGGFYTVPPSKRLPWRLVGLHSTLWQLKNHFTEDMPDPAQQFRWMEELLSASRANNESVLIFSHIPPGKFERFYQFCGEYKNCGNYSGFHWFAEDFNNKYLNLIDKFSDVIVGQLFGHHHTDSFKTFLSENGKPISWGFLAPGVTPWISTLAPETGGNNPGVRLFKYDTKDGKILDYTQYWLNLTEANESGRTVWRKEYSFLEYFGLDQISAQSVSNLITKIGAEKSLFDKYYSINTVKFEEASMENCDTNCRKYHFCAMHDLRYDRFEACVQ